MGVVFNDFLETKLSVQVELEVTDVLSRTMEMIGVASMEDIEERLFISLSRRPTKMSLTMPQG